MASICDKCKHSFTPLKEDLREEKVIDEHYSTDDNVGWSSLTCLLYNGLKYKRHRSDYYTQCPGCNQKTLVYSKNASMFEKAHVFFFGLCSSSWKS